MIGNLLMRLSTFSYQKAFIIGLLLAGLYYLMMFDDGSSIQSQIQTVQASIAEEEQKAQQADAALKEVEQVRVTVGALSEQFRIVSQALPTDIQMSDIIRAVDAVSKSSGVSIKTKEPRPTINREYYEEIPLRIAMEGTYSEVTLFLYYLASTERIMKVNNFVISQQIQNERPTSRLLFEGQVVSYRFLGEAKPTDATAATSAGAPTE